MEKFRSGGFILFVGATEELCKRGEASQGDLLITFKRRRSQYYGYFWEINLTAVLCVCVLDSVFNCDPSMQWTGGVWVVSCALLSLPISVSLSPSPPFLPSPFALPVCYCFFPDFCSPCGPGGTADSKGGGQLSEGCWQLLGFSPGRTTGFLTLPFVSNSAAFV